MERRIPESYEALMSRHFGEGNGLWMTKLAIKSTMRAA